MLRRPPDLILPETTAHLPRNPLAESNPMPSGLDPLPPCRERPTS